MARLSPAVAPPAFDRAAAVDAAARCCCTSLAASRRRRTSDRDNLYVDTDAVRRLSRQIRLEESFGQVDLDGWEARLVDLVRDRGVSRTRKGSGAKYGKHGTRTEVLAARDALFAELQQFKQGRGRRPGGVPPAGAGRRDRHGIRTRSPRPARSISPICWRKARDLIKSNETVRRHLQTQVHAHLRGRIPGYRSHPGGDPAAARERRSRSAIRRAPSRRASCSSSATRSRRSTDFAEPTSSTYWRVRDGSASRAGGRCSSRTSYRSVPSIQNFVNAAFARHMIAEPATLQAGYVPLSRSGTKIRRSPPSSRCPCRSRTAGGVIGGAEGVGEGHRGVVAGCDRGVHRVADGGRSRLDRDRTRHADGARQARARSSRGTSRSCSAGSPASAKT